MRWRIGPAGTGGMTRARGNASDGAVRMNRRDVLTLAGAVAAGGALSLVLRESAPIGIDISANPAAQAALTGFGGPAGGDPHGPIVLAIYSDFACPACRIADRALADALAARGGGVRLLFKDWPIFGPASARAARLAIAADTLGLYRPFAAALYAAPVRLADSDLRRAFEGIGGDWAALLAAHAARAAAIDRLLARTAQEAFTLGLRGTPSFLTRSRLVEGALPPRGFARLFDASAPTTA